MSFGHFYKYGMKMSRRITFSKEKTYSADIKNVLWTFLQVRSKNGSAQYFLVFFNPSESDSFRQQIFFF